MQKAKSPQNNQRPRCGKPRRGLYACLAALLVFAAASFCGCQSVQTVASQMSLAPVVPPRGFLYSHFRAPLILPPPLALPAGNETPERAQSLVYLKIPYVNLDLSAGRAGLQAAAARAGLNTVVYADYEYRSVFGYFQTITIHAWGHPPRP